MEKEFLKFKQYAANHAVCWIVEDEDQIPMLRAGFAVWREVAPPDMEDDEDKFLEHFICGIPMCSGNAAAEEVKLLQPEVEEIKPDFTRLEWGYIFHCFESEVNKGYAPIRVETDGHKYEFVFRNWDTDNPNCKTYEQIIRDALADLEDNPSLLDPINYL